LPKGPGGCYAQKVPVTFSCRDDAVRYLAGRIDYERALAVPYGRGEFRLDRMRELLARLGNPERRMPIIHLAGTKGKGSTAAMIGGVLTAAGYRVGLFTSPHIDRVEQRIAIDGQPCSGEELVALVERLKPVVAAMDRLPASPDSPAENQPTYFEITTAMALVHFAQRRVRAAILEVGLGGRLDSTNICQPVVSVITNISFDHTQQLGNTLAAIAREKAGIIKPGVPVVSGVVEDEPRAVIREICAERNSPLVELGVDFHFNYHPPRQRDSAAMPTVDFRDRRGDAYRGLTLRMLGRHQAANAAVALAALGEMRRMGWELPEAAVRAGLAAVACPARIEIVARQPLVVIDAAHNRASVEALVAVLQESFAAGRRWLIFATTQGKDLRGMLEVLLPAFDRVILTRYTDNPRSVPPETLADVAESLTGSRPPIAATPAEAWDAARRAAAAEDLICVTGSFFLAAEIRGIMSSPQP
jgi:dihydrofolate synthase / folylpolyglutamate synthase